jgi:Protein of unknown function (DUF3180)
LLLGRCYDWAAAVTRTRASTLILLAILGAALGWFLQVVLVGLGRPAIVPPLTLGTVLALIGVIVVILALPIRRVVKGTATAPVDPFYATRIVVLAKASSISGGLLGGAAVGILAFLLTRSVVPGVSSVTMSAATVVGAVILLVAGLIAEKMCTLPPDDEANQDAPAGTASS